MKIKSLLFFLVVLLCSCSAKELNLKVVNTTRLSLNTPDIFYSVENNTGAELKNVEWSINDKYFYTADLPVEGCSLLLEDFTETDGTYFNAYRTKPLVLKAKCKEGSFSVKFDKIPRKQFEEFKKQREALDWYSSLDQIRTMTSDAVPASVNITIELGYKSGNEKALAEITERRLEIVDFLRRFFSECLAEDLRPQNEQQLKMQIRDQINDDILSNSKIKDVKFIDLNVTRP